MANIWRVDRPNNKIELGTTGTTINVASHTASKILALDASKNLEVVTIGTSLNYTRPTLNTIQDIRTTASPEWAGLLTTDKIKFTQVDGNEYIDSLADGYLDYSATTAHRFNMSSANTDVRLEFIGTTNSGLIEWLEDEDAFKIHDDILTDRWLGSDTNTFLGVDVAGSDNLTAGGIWNTGVGSLALEDITTGEGNTIIGYGVGRNITEGNYNIAIGYNTLFTTTTGDYNVAIGYQAGAQGNGDSSVFLGRSAGYYETGSNKLFIDNAIRTNEADGRVKALMYGVFAAAVANQSLTINGEILGSYGAKIGDGGITDYTKIEADGTIEFNGAATVWKDINLGSALLTKPAASAPDTDEFKDEGGNDTGIETYAFAPGEKVSGNFELQHDYKEGSDITFHIHFQGIAAPTGTDKVKWQLIYTVAKSDATLDAVTTIVKEIDFDTQYEFLRADFPVITGTNFSIEDQFLFQFSRITASADEYAGDALIATVGLHYEIDTVGSRAINTK